MRLLTVCIIFVLVACNSAPKPKLDRVAVEPSRRYVAARDGVARMSAVGPDGWSLRRGALVKNSIDLYSPNQYTGVSSNVSLSLNSSSLYLDAAGQVYNSYNNRKAHKKAVNIYNSNKHALETGDYQASMEDRYRYSYADRPVYMREVGIYAANARLVKIQNHTCWEMEEQEFYSPNPAGEQDNQTAGKSIFWVTCPLWVDGKPGRLYVYYNFSVAPRAFQVPAGETAPTRADLLRELRAQIQPTLDSIQFHLPNVWQPEPNNSPSTLYF